MSIEPDGRADGVRPEVVRLLARAVDADRRVRHALDAVADDIFLRDDARLDERTRVALADLHARLIAIVAEEIRGHASRLLIARGASDRVARLRHDPAVLADLLADGGMLRDRGFVAETLARVQTALIADRLVPVASGDRPSLLSRLSNGSDRAVAAGAVAMMVADSRGRDQLARTELPADLHHKLVWWVAAALREAAGPGDPLLDRALADAALRTLAAHDEGDRPAAVAMRLAATIDAHAAELPALIEDALGDRQLSVAVAAIAHALGVEYELAREIVLDHAADRLALTFRGFEMDRARIARILLSLVEADPRRDEQQVVATVGAVMALSPADARAAIMPLTLHHDFRAAILSLARARP